MYLTIACMKTLCRLSLAVIALAALSVSAFGQTNYYISPTGSDSTGTGTSGSPWATLAHALSHVPQVLTGNYTINVADGTYPEPINLIGFVSSGFQLQIAGDNTTPANVIFSGTMTGCGLASSFTTSVCSSGPLLATISGVTLTASASDGVECFTCAGLAIGNINVSGTYSNSGVNHSNHGNMLFFGTVNISGFGNNLGLDIHGQAYASIPGSGTVNITGPGGSNSAVCMVQEFGGGFTLSDSVIGSSNLTITGCDTALLLSSSGQFNAFASTGTVSLSNGTSGLLLTGGSSWNMANAGHLSISNFSTCIAAYGLSIMTQGAGNRTLSGCGTQTYATQGGVIVIW